MGAGMGAGAQGVLHAGGWALLSALAAAACVGWPGRYASNAPAQVFSCHRFITSALAAHDCQRLASCAPSHPAGMSGFCGGMDAGGGGAGERVPAPAPSQSPCLRSTAHLTPHDLSFFKLERSCPSLLLLAPFNLASVSLPCPTPLRAGAYEFNDLDNSDDDIPDLEPAEGGGGAAGTSSGGAPGGFGMPYTPAGGPAGGAYAGGVMGWWGVCVGGGGGGWGVVCVCVWGGGGGGGCGWGGGGF